MDRPHISKLKMYKHICIVHIYKIMHNVQCTIMYNTIKHSSLVRRQTNNTVGSVGQRE